MSYWVHHPADGRPWYQATVFEPPLPKPVPEHGYPHYYVEVNDFTFQFASIAELDVCIDVLGHKLLPNTTIETEAQQTGPGKHWLNKLPSKVKPWQYRERAVRYLQRARAAFVREVSERSPA